MNWKYNIVRLLLNTLSKTIPPQQQQQHQPNPYHHHKSNNISNFAKNTPTSTTNYIFKQY